MLANTDTIQPETAQAVTNFISFLLDDSTAATDTTDPARADSTQQLDAQTTERLQSAVEHLGKAHLAILVLLELRAPARGSAHLHRTHMRRQCETSERRQRGMECV